MLPMCQWTVEQIIKKMHTDNTKEGNSNKLYHQEAGGHPTKWKNLARQQKDLMWSC